MRDANYVIFLTNKMCCGEASVVSDDVGEMIGRPLPRQHKFNNQA